MDTQELRKETLGIKGMHCASCSRSVEQALKKLPGMSDAYVNLVTENAEISWQPGTLRMSDIKRAITDAGFEAVEHEERDAREQRKEKELSVMTRDLLFSLASTIPLFYIAMAPMLPIGLPFPAILDPMHAPLRMVWSASC